MIFYCQLQQETSELLQLDLQADVDSYDRSAVQSNDRLKTSAIVG